LFERDYLRHFQDFCDRSANKDGSSSESLPGKRTPTMHFNFKKLAVSTAVSAALVASGYPANLNAITIASYIAPSSVEASAPGNLVVSTPSPLDVWLDRLAYQESHGRENIKILDVNDQYSYGCLQFQEGTFRKYGMKYGLISEDASIESIIYDCGLQKKIAKFMLSEDYSNWRAWYTSSKTAIVGLPPRVATDN